MFQLHPVGVVERVEEWPARGTLISLGHVATTSEPIMEFMNIFESQRFILITLTVLT